MLATFPGLKVVLEHITTEDSVRFVEAAGSNLAATITAHHLRIDRNAMFEGGLRPHAYCLLGRQAAAPQTGAAQSGDVGKPEILSRHRFSAPSEARKGKRLRLRRHLQRADSA